MNRYSQNFLKEVFYKYWMCRVPELDEDEAIDHLEWELRSMSCIPDLENCRTSSKTKKRLKLFLEEKNINFSSEK